MSRSKKNKGKGKEEPKVEMPSLATINHGIAASIASVLASSQNKELAASFRTLKDRLFVAHAS
jgi:pyocin large subunit-like protein